MRLIYRTSPFFISLVVFCLAIGLMAPRVALMPIGSSSTITDMTGRKIAYERPAQSLAILAPVLSPYAAIDGNLEHVIAVSHTIQTYENKGLFAVVFPQIALLPLAATSEVIPDAERIMFLQPQVVIAWNVQSGALQAIGYPGLIELSYSSVESIPKIWALLGQVSGREARATDLFLKARALQQNLQNVLPEPREPQTALPMGRMGNTWWIGGKNYKVNSLLEYVGAINPAHGRNYHGLSDPEAILLLDPDLILIPGEMDYIAPSEIYDDPQWQPLHAVRERRIYRTPAHSVYNAVVDKTLMLIWLAEILHPSLPRMTRVAYQHAYAEAYHYKLTDIEIDQALFFGQNRVSAGYSRFKAIEDP